LIDDKGDEIHFSEASLSEAIVKREAAIKKSSAAQSLRSTPEYCGGDC
jgi:hypothetical protein